MTETKYDSGRMSELHHKRDSLLKAARTTLDAAKSDGDRELTASELRSVEQGMAEAKSLEPAIQEQGRLMVKSVMSLGSMDDYDSEGRRSSGVFTEDVGRKLVAAVREKGVFRTELRELSSKAALVSSVLPTAGAGVKPGLFPSAFPIASLFNVEQTASPSVRYYVLGGATAGVVAEGATKPDSGLTVTPKDVVLEKVATTVRFSDEFAEDASFLLNFLQAELVNAVVTKENSEILAGLTVSGILTGAGAASTIIDLAATAIAGQEALNGASPTAVLVNPATLAAIRQVKSTTGGDYVLDPVAGGPPMLHGVPLHSTAATPATTAWVISGGGVTVYRKGGISAEINWNADDFVTNQRTLRVEERFAVAVVRPSCLTQLTLS